MVAYNVAIAEDWNLATISEDLHASDPIYDEKVDAFID